MTTPLVVMVSGSLRPGSTSDRVAEWCARQCAEEGVRPVVLPGAALEFPFYRPGLSAGHDGVRGFLATMAAADGLVLISPAYHGTVTGLLKNALDYLNDLDGPLPFLDGRPVGCVAVGAGVQGAVSTLATLRTVSHALRAWPTPLGVTVTESGAFGVTATSAAERQCRTRMAALVGQVASMSRHLAARRAPLAAGR
ncbi:putative NADPH-dependent FMN reductase [Actinoplanes missouriensis 431]|uniref:Putative NADPH-dependent FMN reductase n=1 Tax=Actinoplanes missouriensis (strain ATCC 14538 / DSM 43046 / CBS 188.64 / JCM 3121 / NBRC 102363 / NCIMB 12654 / NRRL B-3342 / UNCC 431) TaxID=512565 RepID=I0HBA5_ACTM4|nr:NAD(P)H-dependent oxidoreductase [Actinoplanes missouriensis]BAL90292.1 putative NADPH-dependent FMN reductase [Actinoplanes missouriensis 431]